MARRRFFVDQINGDQAELGGEDAHHLGRVLRAEAGQQFEISDGQQLYLAEITEAGKQRVLFRILEKLEVVAPLPPFTLCAALIKFDRFEWMVEKATELGVTRIIPVETARTEPGLLAAATKRRERWQKIARESSQQSRRLAAPEIAPAQKLAQLKVTGWHCRLEEQAGSGTLWNALASANAEECAVLIGPEGGWTDHERERLDGEGWQPVTLGPTVLRAETAAIAAAAVIAQWQTGKLK